jgi:hypothetical protein
MDERRKLERELTEAQEGWAAAVRGGDESRDIGGIVKYLGKVVDRRGAEGTQGSGRCRQGVARIRRCRLWRSARTARPASWSA